jgi:hypothetical protein
MSAFRLASAAALIFVALGSTWPTFAQPTAAEINRSHDIQDLPLPTGNAESALLQRLQGNRLANAMRKNGMLAEGDLDQWKQHPEQLIDLLRKHGLKSDALDALKKNPALLDLAVEKIKRGEGLPDGVQVPPTQLNSALKELANQANDPVQHSQPPPEVAPLPTETERPGQTIKPKDPALSEPDRDMTPQGTSPRTGEEDNARLGLEEKLQGWAERLQAMNPQWRDSPAFQRALQTLARNAGQEDPKWRKLSEAGEHLRERWSEWSKSAQIERFWPPRRFQFPDAPPIGNFPNVTRAIADRTPNTSGLPQMGAPELSGGGILNLLAWVVGCVAGAICLRKLWLYWQETNQESRRKQGLSWAWKIDPRNVSSREDLIRAYEYLALSRLGIAVKSWNHLAIAAGLGSSTDPLRQNAALSLTNAYEHARYAPPEETLPKEVIVEARRQLCLLAGVAGA